MEFKEQVRGAVDIVRVVGEWVRLKKVGHRYLGLCPFHQEKTPSFNVSPDKQFFKCFGCGKGGDVFTFVMEIAGVDFYEALKMLAERAGLAMPQRMPGQDPHAKQREGLREAHEIAFRYFRSQLETGAGAEARAYLERRGVSAEAMAEFGLGYSDRGGQALTRELERAGFDAETLRGSGLVIERDTGGFFDRFRGRLIFPIHDESGKVIAFAGRALGDEQPKYLNSPETEIYRKSHVLYNLHRAKAAARKDEFAILVEGYMDVIGVAGAGIKNVVASCGTALTSEQVRSLKRHAEKVVVNFDPDAAGANAAERSIQMFLEAALHVRVLQLGHAGDEVKLDPDEFIKRFGAEAYRERLRKAGSYFLWLCDRARQNYDLRSAEGRMEGFRAVLAPAIERVPDKLERLAIANEVASYLGVDPALVRQQLRTTGGAPARGAAPAESPLKAVTDSERTLLRGLLADEVVRQEVMDDLESLPGLDELSTGRLFRALIALARAQGTFRYEELSGRLDAADQSLMDRLVFADSTAKHQGTGEFTLERAQRCLEAMWRDWTIAQRAEWKRKIREAERRGELEQALRLTEEHNAIDENQWKPRWRRDLSG